MDHWIDHAVWWQVYPLRFLDAEPRALPADATPIPRLDRIEPWLDYYLSTSAATAPCSPPPRLPTGQETGEYSGRDSPTGPSPPRGHR
jgi:hypothetical protein